MKLAWFTPFMRQSAIARYSKVVVEGLARRIDVTLMLPKGTPGDLLETTAATTLYGPEDLPALLDEFDASVFNMGDSSYHFAVWDALQCAHSRLHPAIAILHDTFYLNFFNGYARARGDTGRFLAELTSRYGRAGALRAVAAVNSNAPLESLDPYPLFEPIVEAADAFVVHSDYCRRRLRLDADPDVLELFIPAEYATPDADAAVTPDPPGFEYDGKIVILTVGLGNPNKCLHLILEALAQRPNISDKVTYVAAGEIRPDYLSSLKSIAARHGLSNVDLRGYVTDAELHGLIHRADICVNLRQPCPEGGSASLLEMLVGGKPTIVFNDGVYSEVPDRCVRKISKVNAVPSLASALDELIGSVATREALGSAAQEFATRDWARSRYVDEFVEFIDARQRPWTVRKSVRATVIEATARATAVGLGGEPLAIRILTNALGAWAP
jgi:glycosyltransferase involved in cell wall biosynthesis